MIQKFKRYWHDFSDSTAAAWRELREEHNWLGLALLALLMPMILLSAILAALADIGPE